MKILLIILSFSIWANEIVPKKSLKIYHTERKSHYIFLEQEYADLFINQKKLGYSQSNIVFRKSIYENFSMSFLYGESHLSTTKSHFANIVGINMIISSQDLSRLTKKTYLISNKYKLKLNEFKTLSKVRTFVKTKKNNSFIYQLGYTSDTYLQVLDKGTFQGSYHLSLAYEWSWGDDLVSNFGYRYSYNELFAMSKFYFSIGF